MTNTIAIKSTPVTPFPWQNDFAQEISDSESGHWLLAAPAGAGKTMTAITAVLKLRDRNPTARIFITAATSASASRFAERLHRQQKENSAGAKSVFSVSPSWYRRQKSKTEHLGDIWSEGSTYVFTSSLFKRPSAADSLRHVTWDLGIVDDLDILRDRVEEQKEYAKQLSALNGILTSGQCRRFFALSREVCQPFSKPLSVRQRNQAIVEAEGVTFETSTLDYERTGAEQALHAELARIGQYLSPEANAFDFLMRRDFEAQTSSLYTVDQWLYSLKRLVELSSRAQTAQPVDSQSRAPDIWRGIDDLRSLWRDLNEAATWTETLFDEMNTVESDAKSDRMKQFLANESESHICSMTFDTKTAGYLSVSLEETGHPVHHLETGHSLEERNHVLHAFEEDGGILLVADAVIPDLNVIIEADAVVHYDLPMRTGSMQRRKAAVLPREGDVLPTYALRDTTSAVDGEEALLQQYGFLTD